MTAAVSPSQFTSDDAKSAIKDILASFETQENIKRMNDARETAGNDMLKTMQIVFPLATQIQMSVIPKYGFPGDGEGIIRFTQTIKHYERQDDELSSLNMKLRNILMPQMTAPSPPGSYDSPANSVPLSQQLC